MKVSIITVCFNAGKTIEKTIESIISQTYPAIEHIVIDGASTDGTLNILERYRTSFAHFISEPDMGIYDAMNKGIKCATGDIITFLNADDVYAHNDIVEKATGAITKENLDAVYADSVFFDGRNPEHIIRRYRSGVFYPRKLSRGWMPSHPTLFLKRSLYERHGFFRTDYKIAGDFELIIRMFKSNDLRVKYMPEVWVKMQMGGISTAGIANTLLLNKEILRAYRENGISSNWFKICSKYPAKLLGYIFK